MAECSVRVICRFRPFNEREKKEMGSVDNSKSGVAITFPSDQSVNIKTPENPKQVFNLDFIFDSNKSQDFIYQHGVAVAAEDIMKGVNATIFAYGQTGAGKTFTMFGPDDYVPHPQLWGVVPRACTFIFDKINSSTDDSVEYSAKGSFVEVYNEKIRDLLDTRNDDLKVRESPAKGIYIEGVKEEPLCSSEDVWALLALGDKAKAKAATAMNARSSRSHSVFILRLEQIQAAGGSKVSRLNLVDLAGSERISKTGAAGSVLEEAKNINKSLSALGNCISALTTGSGHVPFRDSQLTRLLQVPDLTTIRTGLSTGPAAFNVEETIGTLRFAARAKLIKNVVKANVQRSASELEKMLEMLEKDMKAMKIYVAQLEATVEWMKGPNYKPGAEPPVKATRPSCLQGGGGDVGGEGDSFVESASRQLASAAASSNTAAELATLKAQLEVALERQGELEEENKVLNLQLKEKAEECESKVASAEREVQEALEDKKRAEFMNNQAQLQCDELRNEAKTLAKSNDELKKLLHEMQSQANQSGAVAKLEMEVVELLEKLEETKRLAASSEERLAVLEQELSDYKELNDLLEIDNANANGRADQMTVVVENLRRQAAERAAELQRMQDATRGGDSALKKELAASLQVITKLEADINASRSQTDDVKLAMASLEKQLENSSARLAESDAKMKALVVEHTEKVAALNAKLEEASKKAKENASKGTSADVNAFTLEILELRRDLESRTAKSISQLKQMESLALRISDLEESQTQAKKEAFELEDKFEAAKFEKELLLQEKAQMDALVEELQQQLTRLPLQQRARFAKAAAKASTSDKVEFGQHMLRATGGRDDGDVKDGAAAAGGGGA